MTAFVPTSALLSKISSLTDVSKLREFTLEAGRPDTITAEKFAVAKEYGVTRVSVNPQTLCDEVLCAIGRSHTAEDFFRAFPHRWTLFRDSFWSI